MFSQVSFQQTSSWVDVKFSCMIKVLDEKQKATELFLKQQQEVAIGEAEARLSQLQDYSKVLLESQAQITAVHHLSDTDLIKVDSALLFLFIVCLNAANVQPDVGFLFLLSVFLMKRSTLSL